VFVHFTVVIYQINTVGSKFLPLPEELIAMSRVQVGKGMFLNFRNMLETIHPQLQLHSWKQEVTTHNIKVVKRTGGDGYMFRCQKFL
jgi:hypothetical protein